MQRLVPPPEYTQKCNISYLLGCSLEQGLQGLLPAAWTAGPGGIAVRVYTTKERLLDAASRIISEESLSQLSIEHVADRAGLSRRTFFLHFNSKDQLLAEVLEYLRPAQAERYRQWTEGLDPALGVEERICTLFVNIVEAAAQPGWKGCCFVRISAELGDRTGHPVHAVVAEAHQDMERWFEAELIKGDYPDPAVVAKQLVVILNGLLLMELVNRKNSYSEVVLHMLPHLLALGRALPPPAHPALPYAAAV